jgi:hypothetical protein
MRRVFIALLTLSLAACGSEGLDIEPSEVFGWFNQHHAEIDVIKNEFQSNPCLRRVELSPMGHIDQYCKSNASLKDAISRVQTQLRSLNVVLAVADRNQQAEGKPLEGFSVLLRRWGIAVSGGGLELYFTKQPSDWLKRGLACGELASLGSDGWYLRHLSSEDACRAN